MVIDMIWAHFIPNFLVLGASWYSLLRSLVVFEVTYHIYWRSSRKRTTCMRIRLWRMTWLSSRSWRTTWLNSRLLWVGAPC